MSKKYYSLDNILRLNPTYAMVIGRRSNGKSYAAIKYGLEQYIKNGSQFAIVRRWDEDFTKYIIIPDAGIWPNGTRILARL